MGNANRGFQSKSKKLIQADLACVMGARRGRFRSSSVHLPHCKASVFDLCGHVE